MLDLRNDPRWLRLSDPLFSAKGVSGGAFDLDISQPADWTGGEPVGGDDDFDPDNFLASDLCIIGGARFFIRAVVELAILGGGGKSLAYAGWAEVSRAGFGQYLPTLDDTEVGVGTQIAAMLASRLAGHEAAFGQPCNVRLRGGGQRPLLTLNDPTQPLALEQTRGITLDRMLDLYAAAGIDLRPALDLTH
jgi:hypothetical protein